MTDTTTVLPDPRYPVPESPPTLVPGRSAYDWSRFGLLTTAVGFLALISWPLISEFGPDRHTREILLAITGVIAFVVGACGTLFVIVKMTARQWIELAAGYTTLYGRAYPYWQLDPKTGEVLRRPGERKAKKRR